MQLLLVPNSIFPPCETLTRLCIIQQMKKNKEVFYLIQIWSGYRFIDLDLHSIPSVIQTLQTVYLSKKTTQVVWRFFKIPFLPIANTLQHIQLICIGLPEKIFILLTRLGIFQSQLFFGNELPLHLTMHTANEDNF